MANSELKASELEVLNGLGKDGYDELNEDREGTL